MAGGEGHGMGSGLARGKTERVAVPAMPMWLAIICCILNFLIPGLGTIVAGFSTFCCARNEDMTAASRVGSCCISFFIGFLQLITIALLLFGWIWSCVWGVFFIGMSDEEIDGLAVRGLVEQDLCELFPKKGPRAKFRALLAKVIYEEPVVDSEVVTDKNAEVYMIEPVVDSEAVTDRNAEVQAKPVTTDHKPAVPTTVQRLLGASGTIEKMSDRYHLLRVQGIKVYEGDFLKSQPDLRRQYYVFRNEESLKLLQSKTPKKLIDGLVIEKWRIYGRRLALLEIKRAEIHYDTSKSDPFHKYDVSYMQKQTQIESLNKKIEAKVNDKIERIKQGSLSTSSKTDINNLISLLKERRTLLMTEIDCIAKAWDSAMRKYIRTGPPKKRGRKPKKAVVFKTAAELKKEKLDKAPIEVDDSSADSSSVDVTESDPPDLDVVGDSNMDNTTLNMTESEPPDLIFSGLSASNTTDNMTDSDLHGGDFSSGNSTAVDSTITDPPDQHIVVEVTEAEVESKLKEDILIEKLNIPNYEEIDGLTSNISQFNVNEANSDQGSSACMGIVVKTVSNYFKSTEKPLTLREETVHAYIRDMKEVCNIWEDQGYGPTLIVEAVKNLNIVNIEIKTELWWRDGQSMSCVDKIIDEIKQIQGRKAVIVTVQPAHSFVVLFDNDNNQILFNSHIHLKHHSEQIKDGLAIIFSRSNILTYALTDYMHIVNCSSVEGEMTLVLPKNL